MRAYSRDLRFRVLDAYLEEEGSQREIARRFQVSRSFVQKLVRLHRETGSIEARTNGSGKKIGKEGRVILQRLASEAPDATLQQFCAAYLDRTGIEVSISTMHRALREIER